MNYTDAIRNIAADFKRRQNEYELYELECMRTNPEFAECERRLRSLTLDRALGKKVNAEALREASAKNKKLRKELGLIPPEPKCRKCGDSGRVNGKICDCAVKLAINSLDRELGIPLRKFEEVDYSVYGEKADAYKSLFDKVNAICSAYPDNKKRCIVIGGTTGNGKTYLAGCAAEKMLSRGKSVYALTAFSAGRAFLAYHTTFDERKPEYLDPLLDCSLLIIDDLGTESILKNVTLEYLYLVINERNTSGKLTLVTTNLFPDNILARYGERIYSRLFDKSLSFSYYLDAKDLRKVL